MLENNRLLRPFCLLVHRHWDDPAKQAGAWRKLHQKAAPGLT
jgi:hypothetical protein